MTRPTDYMGLEPTAHTIRLLPAYRQTSLDLLDAPCLKGRVTVDGEMATIDYLSTGQALCWQYVAWVNRQDDAPNYEAVRELVDAENVAHVGAVLTREGWVAA
jgi:hypothetical protein